MHSKPLAPVLAGTGMAGGAIARSLDLVSRIDAGLRLLPIRTLARGESPVRALRPDAVNVLFLANPSALHAGSLLDGVRAGFDAIAVEKPVCTRPEEIAPLRAITVPVTVFHGYRAMWATRAIRKMIGDGDLGEVFAFEARYWQSSGARAALSGASAKDSWKNDPGLNGPRDALTDLGSHVADLCLHLMGDKPLRGRCWLSYRNAAATHRDTHVHLHLTFAGGRMATASISKTVHGATNDLEYTVVGTRAAATWSFLRPDEVRVGSGSRMQCIRREEPEPSSASAPFHGLGWLEGYACIVRQTLRRAAGLSSTPVPTLGESLDAMEALLHASVEVP